MGIKEMVNSIVNRVEEMAINEMKEHKEINWDEIKNDIQNQLKREVTNIEVFSLVFFKSLEQAVESKNIPQQTILMFKDLQFKNMLMFTARDLLGNEKILKLKNNMMGYLKEQMLDAHLKSIDIKNQTIH